MEPDRKSPNHEKSIKRGDENRGKQKDEMQSKPRGASCPINSQRKLRHSAGKLSLKKTKL